ncbi:hypothetical protein JNW90_10670 [Micromonospora sp. STR1s_5]|nr:hypothetical protein [Micromonospora sp. STR1s_5]
MVTNLGDLSRTLVMIQATDPSAEGHTGPDTPQVAARYAERNALVWQALGQALDAGLRGGVGRAPADPDRPVVAYIELPSAGQVSWHLPDDGRDQGLPLYDLPWDGHTVWEKYARIDLFTGAHGVFSVCAVEGCTRCGEVAGYMESRWRAALESQGIYLRHVSTLTPEERAEHNRQELLAVMADEHAAAADPDPDFGKDGVW